MGRGGKPQSKSQQGKGAKYSNIWPDKSLQYHDGMLVEKLPDGRTYYIIEERKRYPLPKDMQICKAISTETPNEVDEE